MKLAMERFSSSFYPSTQTHSFKAQRAARMERNPATGEALKIKAKTTVKFRRSKAAKDAVVPPKA